MIAVNGTPLLKDFPNTAISGLTLYFLCNPPNVSLKPEVHSSKMSTIPFFLDKFLTFFKKFFLGFSFLCTSINMVPIFFFESTRFFKDLKSLYLKV